MRDDDYYTTKKIMQIIKCYHINIQNLKELQYKNMNSVGVAQYGLEASLPKGNNISNIVEKEVLRQIENTKYWAETITDIKYLQARWHRITDEKEAQVLNLCLSGFGAGDIAFFMKMDRSGVYRILERIAEQIKSYPQQGATNSTNYELQKRA